MSGQAKRRKERLCEQCGRSYKMTAIEFRSHQELHNKANAVRNSGFNGDTEIKWLKER